MEKIDVEYQFQLDENVEIKNIIVADQKEIFEKDHDFIIRGKVFFEIDILKDDTNKKITTTRDLNLTLSKSTYSLKDISFSLEDYSFINKDNILFVTLNYLLSGEDVCFEKFCILDDNDIESKLRNYLHREGNNKINIEVDKIVLLDPVIEEEKIELEVENEKKEETIINEEKEVNKPLFKERYTTSHLYYRVKKNETIDIIAAKYNISPSSIKKINNIEEVKENMLIQIKKDV